MSKSSIFSYLLLIVLFIIISGKMLDYEAELTFKSYNFKNENEIYSGFEDVSILNNNKDAILLIHGISGSPSNFSSLINKIKNYNIDIHAPLLPFHGRGLKNASKANKDQIINFVTEYIKNISDKYQNIYVLGHSMGGAIVSNIFANEKSLLDVKNSAGKNKFSLILYSPALHIHDPEKNYFLLKIYNLWRNYCNYPSLGCGYIDLLYEEKDNKRKIFEMKNLRYFTTSLLYILFELSINNKKTIRNLDFPFSIILAEDDHFVDFEKTKSECKLNKNNCKFYYFKTGNHYIEIPHPEEFFKVFLPLIGFEKN